MFVIPNHTPKERKIRSNLRAAINENQLWNIAEKKWNQTSETKEHGKDCWHWLIV